ncbi:hypothetical protein BS47DRAFT_1388480 [Hydnum rufescens UP504]|uniref:Uncharacterized protein n=1 Tax=Hydnum rufescens UP504 TaxID=1448309 RepID=A0A9P6B7R4_9AGAM|nr:hypothetical protein BS47DRAFT_1388480 [Hydnum rufescens UP504]
MATTNTAAMDGEIPYNESNATARDTNERAKGLVQAQAPDVPHGDALKSDDVIELQAFLELFENMAVIDVYAGSESLVTSSGRVAGLPTKEQLDIWTCEWENIESETEQFDQGI